MGRRHDDGARGQALVEVAMVAPLFFALLFGIIDLGRVIWANDVVANAAREGARFASVHAGTVALTTEVSKDDIRQHVLDFLVAAGVDPQVTVCFSSVQIAAEQQGCTGDVDQAGAYFDRGNLVTVRVSSQVPLIVTAILGGGTFGVGGESTVLINN